MTPKFKKTVLLSGCILIASFSCNQYNASTTKKDLLDKSGIDITVRPQDDFFHYVNGTWIKNTEIPASEPAWGSFSILYENTTQILKSLLDSCTKLNALKGSNEQKVGDLYASAMDSAAIEQKGITPLKGDLERIAAIQTSKDVLHEVAIQYNMNVSSLISFYASQDDKNSNEIVAHFDQGGLGLPNKDYYVLEDSSSTNIRDGYVNYIATMFQLQGNDSALAHEKAIGVLNIETALAKASKSPVERRDAIANYNKMTLAELNKQTPGINWSEFINSLGIKQDTVLVGQPAFYKALDRLLQSITINDWKNYLNFHLLIIIHLT